MIPIILFTGFVQWPGRPSKDLVKARGLSDLQAAFTLAASQAGDAWREVLKGLYTHSYSEEKANSHLETYALRYVEVLDMLKGESMGRWHLLPGKEWVPVPPSAGFTPQRYLAFTGPNIHPMGGGRDLIGTSDLLEEALDGAAGACAAGHAQTLSTVAPARGSFTGHWWQVVDGETLKIVGEGTAE